MFFVPSFCFGQKTLAVPMDSVPRDTLLGDPGGKGSPLFTFRAERVDVETALGLFAETVRMRFRLDTLLEGKLSVNFKDATMPQAMAQLLATCGGCQWYQENDLLVIRGSQRSVQDSTPSAGVLEKIKESSDTERLFRIDYPRLRRTNIGTSTVGLSGASGDDAGKVQMSSQDDIVFWDEIEVQIRQILGDSAMLVSNRLSGVLYMKGVPSFLDAAEKFLDAVVPAATRQVEITARIYEVTLSDDRSLGVDWSQVGKSFDLDGMGFRATMGSQTIQSQGLKASTFNLDFSRDGGSLVTMLTAMKEQGDVRAVSQPRVVTMNNQPAMVKVGTDFPYFTVTQTVPQNNELAQILESVRLVTVGIILSVTPQISGDGWVTLGVQPVITDLVETKVSSHGSSAPVIDVKQSFTLVRLRDRETVRISGLLQDKDKDVQRKIPLLGDIPWLGALFRWSYTEKLHKELVIFITPRIL
jgi:MSHA type pilus biogenesis protein MshL